MNGKNYRFGLSVTILVLLSCGVVTRGVMRAEPAAPGAMLSEAESNKILAYYRMRFGYPDSIKLSLGTLQNSPIARDFNEAAITLDDGKKRGTQPILISKDAHYLVVFPANGNIELHQNTAAEMEQRIREAFKVPANQKLSVGGFKRSQVVDFEQGTLTVNNGSNKLERVVLVTQDGKHLIVGELYNMTIDLKQLALRTISLHDVPTQGPATAPVTIVEYADLQCPTCARVHEFLETQVLPRYGNKVRVVFKEFPLVGFHDWSPTAAVACQCAYELNPASYVPLRSAIFRNQQLINITNLRESLLSFGEQAGLDRVQLAGCIDAKSSYPRIQRDLAEGKRLDVNQTPTLFINGKMMIGLPSEAGFFKAVDEALNGM